MHSHRRLPSAGVVTYIAINMESEGTSKSHKSSGPSLEKRSNSVGTPLADAVNRSSQNSIQKQRSGSGHAKVPRQRSFKRTEDEEKLKKSRAWANAYELSQDLHDKQLEMLERKYGGHLRTKRAARIIQQAFRQYCMNKNFDRLRSEAPDKRLSRRFGELGRSNTIWTDMVSETQVNTGMQMKHASSSENITSMHEFSCMEDSFNQNIVTSSSTHRVTQSSRTRTKVVHKSQSLSITVTRDQGATGRDRKPLQRSMGLDLSTIKENSKGNKRKSSASPEETNNNRNSYPELNDSSASDSPQDTPVEPTVDLHSVNFENLLESKETDILNDSFHSDGSVGEGATGPIPDGAAMVSSSSTIRSDTSAELSAVESTSQHVQGSYCNYSLLPAENSSNESVTGSVHGDVQIHVEDAELEARMAGTFHQTNENDHPSPPLGEMDVTKVYANQEVHLRKKKTFSPTELSNQGASASSNSMELPKKHSPEASPIWKRKSTLSASPSSEDMKRMSNISEASEPDSLDTRSIEDRMYDHKQNRVSESFSSNSDTASMGSDGGGLTYQTSLPHNQPPPGYGTLTSQVQPKITDRQRKRLYRIGLNLFNKKPEKGIKYLIERRFIDNRPSAVAKFLIARKGLSKQMIGEYLGNLQKQFNMEALECFSCEIDLAGLQVDVALRKFQSFFRMPGEAQKIERLMEAFASRYCMCNPDQVKKFKSPDAVFLLAFAIIMLNTDLHNTNIKQERKMKLEDFIKNLRGIDAGDNIDRDILIGIYERIKVSEFKPGADHVSQVSKVEQMIAGKKPQLSLPHRRLVCYCRLYEVNDPNKREKLGLHQREVFLFNDLLMVTKIFSKKKNNVTYSFRQSYPLCGMLVYLFETPHYQFGVRLTTNIDGKVLITFNARNEHDRTKFVEDLKEAILEMNEMEALRIDEELQKQVLVTGHNRNMNRYSKDSGVMDIELLKPTDPGVNRLSAPECGLKKNTLSNSLIDITENSRRGSGGSLDSGMASSAGSSSRENCAEKGMKSSGSSGSKFGFFGKKKASKVSLKSNLADASEV